MGADVTVQSSGVRPALSFFSPLALIIVLTRARLTMGYETCARVGVGRSRALNSGLFALLPSPATPPPGVVVEASRVFRGLLSVRRSCDERYKEQVFA